MKLLPILGTKEATHFMEEQERHWMERQEAIEMNIPAFGRQAISSICGAAWNVVRLLLLAVLVILEPIVQVFLTAIALVAAVLAFFFEFGSQLADGKFWELLALGLGSFATLVAYYGMLRLLRG